MKKNTINLYFDMEFTSLSPDAQIISIGIVSDEVLSKSTIKDIPDSKTGEKWDCDMYRKTAKSFYAEFTDFDINRCDDWVKENVVGKLKYYNIPDNKEAFSHDLNCISIPGNTISIKKALKEWLSQFSDYDIQFVVDCGTFDWYYFLQLIAEWDIFDYKAKGIKWANSVKTGLPKLPSNISPVPQDLNDLIAFKKGISVRDAFDLNREELAFGHHSEGLKKRTNGLDANMTNGLAIDPMGIKKHNALWDAKVIKTIYQTLTK